MQQTFARRYHRKTKSGCAACRRRRVKCDETHPTCANCLRASLRCEYPFSGTPAPPLQPRSGNVSPQTHPDFETTQKAFDLQDLFLMNHFSTVTSLDLFRGKEQQSLWQKEIPAQARSSPMLMHAILSVSALHLAHLEPSERSTYYIRALYHHNSGLQLYNSQMKHLSRANIHPAFTFTIIITVWVYGSATTTGDLMELDDILGLLDIIRGAKALFDVFQDDILTHMVGQVIATPTPSSDSRTLPLAVSRALDHIQGRVGPLHASAITQLRRLLAKMVHGDAKPALSWPAQVSDELWSQVRDHDPTAILIFGYYAILLRYCDGRHWWMTGWSNRILRAVEDMLVESDKGFLVSALDSVNLSPD